MGALEYRKLVERIRFWEEFIAFLRFAESSIRYIALPVEQLLRRYREGSGSFLLIESCVQACEEGLAFPIAWGQAVKKAETAYALPPGDTAVLERFGAGLGVTDVEGQTSHCQMFFALAEELRQTAKEEKTRKGKLSLLLGVSLGLGMVLLLL